MQNKKQKLKVLLINQWAQHRRYEKNAPCLTDKPLYQIDRRITLLDLFICRGTELTMALEGDGESMAMSDANGDNFEASKDTNNKDGIENQRAWIGPNPMMRPTLFSGGGEDPLAHLDLYCQSDFGAKDNSDNGNSQDGATAIADADELLSVAEFLFGQKALTAALAIVDSRRSLITKLIAPSGRFVHTIRSSSSSSSNSSSAMAVMDVNDANYRHDGEHYLCILSPSQSSRSLPPIRYCSCRSFLEKSTRKVTALSLLRTQGNASDNSRFNSENQHDGPPVCKHLLALSLLPHLVAASKASASRSYQNTYSYSYPEIKSITEKEFATLVLDRIL